MGEFNSDDHYIYYCGQDDHYIYYCGQESLRRNGVAIMVNKRVQHTWWIYVDIWQNQYTIVK